MAHHLAGIAPLTVVTNALNVALTIGSASEAQVILLGGMLSREASSTVGPLAEQTLANLSVKRFSSGTQALDLQDGLTDTTCMHGTFIAGILSGKRNSPAPAICPDCTFLIRPIFAETTSGREHMPSATPLELAAAIVDCIDAGAQVINLSLALAHPSSKGEQALEQALNHAMRRGTIVVVAAGNQSTLGSSTITRHPWVIPVVACDLKGRPMNESNLGSSIGRRGLSAPGDSVTSLGSEGQFLTLGGTSVAVPFVTGTAALVWSEFPRATGPQVKRAITNTTTTLRRISVVPPLTSTRLVESKHVSRTLPRKRNLLRQRRTDTAGKTDQQTLHAVLSKRENRYLIHELCWVLSIQGLETYLLVPRDSSDLDLLVEPSVQPQAPMILMLSSACAVPSLRRRCAVN